MNKGENLKINQDLWRRFLIKNNYSGRYYRNGLKIKLLNMSHCIVELIETPKLTEISQND